MSLRESFYTQEETALTDEFLKKGYIIRDVEDREAFDSLRHHVVEIACRHLKLPLPQDDHVFLDEIHKHLSVEKLNAFRLDIYNTMNSYSWFRPTYYAMAKRTIDLLVGNELAMQNKINFSIQLPKDESSLIGIHADSYTGETPFQVVQWIPLVDVAETKSMYILSPEKNRKYAPRLKELSQGGSHKLFEAVRADCQWLTIPYGKTLVFSPNLLHGNIVNQTPESRWSMNCRFTGLFTPYTSAERKLGDFYLPATTRAVSRIGMKFNIPEGYNK